VIFEHGVAFLDLEKNRRGVGSARRHGLGFLIRNHRPGFDGLELIQKRGQVHRLDGRDEDPIQCRLVDQPVLPGEPGSLSVLDDELVFVER